MEAIFKSNSLETVNVHVVDHAFSLLKGSDLPHLKNLFCYDNGIDDTAVEKLSHRISLEALNITGNRFTDVGIRSLRNNRYLHTLELGESLITNGCIETLLELPSLHCLDIQGTTIDSDGIRELSNAKMLQSLSIHDSQVTQESAVALSTLETLTEIYFYFGGVQPETIKRLIDVPSLHEIVFIKSRSSRVRESNRALIEPLSALPQLRHVRGVCASLAIELHAIRPDLLINGSYFR